MKISAMLWGEENITPIKKSRATWVEHEHPSGAGLRLNQRLALRIVNRRKLRIVVEILDLSGVVDESKPFDIQRKLVG